MIARLALAAVFLVAATAKALDQPRTRETLRAFGLVGRAARLGAPALPAAEACVALALLVGATTAGGVAALALLGVFCGALVRAMRAGEAPECHCFGQLGSAPAGREALARNAALAALALLVVLGGRGAAVPAWTPALVAGLAVAAAGVSHRRRPGVLGRPAPDWTSPAVQDRGGRPVSLSQLAGAQGPLLLVFVSPDCGPCVALLHALPHWTLDGLPRVVVLASGPVATIEGVRVLAADAGLRAEYRIAGTPGALIVDGQARIASRPALGAPAIEALARSWSGGRGAPAVSFQGFAASAYGVTVEVLADSERLAEAARGALPAGALIGAEPDADAPAVAARWIVLSQGTRAALYRDGTFAGRTDSEAAILELLAAAIRLHVAELAPERAFVHAGVVAWRGRAIVVPGRSFTGKSTLVSALLRAGATYVSDEYAVLDDAGRVHPYVKPIALRHDGGWVSYEYAVTEFTTLPPADGPVRVGAIVRAPYEPGASWRPVAASSGTGAMVLIANAVGVRHAPARVMAAVRAAAEGAVALDAPRGDADETARALLEHLDALASGVAGVTVGAVAR